MTVRNLWGALPGAGRPMISCPSRVGWMAGTALLVALAGCVERQTAPDPYNQPLRRAETDAERLYLVCVSRDPLFRSDVCRQARLELKAGSDR